MNGSNYWRTNWKILDKKYENLKIAKVLSSVPGEDSTRNKITGKQNRAGD